jgi:hypothetical protein
MGRKPIYESGAEKFRAYRSRKKEDNLSMIAHYGVSAELFADTENGVIPRPHVTLEQLPDGVYYVGDAHHAIAIKLGDTTYERGGLDLTPVNLTTAKIYTGTAQQLARVPGYMQRFYMPSELISGTEKAGMN